MCFSGAANTAGKKMKIELIQELSVEQLGWAWCAYWRLIGVKLRIQLKQQAWLKSKITLAKAESAPKSTWSLPVQSVVESMHVSVQAAARVQFWQATCLPRSIVLADMLVKKGINAAVILGVNKNGHALASHAWVEVNGVMVCEPESVSGEFLKVTF